MINPKVVYRGGMMNHHTLATNIESNQKKDPPIVRMINWLLGTTVRINREMAGPNVTNKHPKNST